MTTTPTRNSVHVSPVLLCLLALTACGGGGGGGTTGGGGTGGPLPTGTVSATHSGLLSAAAGSGQVRVHYRLPGAGFEAALFHANSSVNLVSGAAQQEGLTGTSFTVSSLANGQERFFALGIRPTGSSTYVQAGEILRARPSATTIHVDASAAAGGNGSAGTPFRTLQEGMTAMASQPGANVWVRDGSYTAALVPPGAQVYGGFASFSLGSRDPAAGLTIVTSTGVQAAMEANTAGNRVVIDGFRLDGNNSGFYGIDLQNVDLDVRSVTIRRTSDRGLRLRNTSTNENLVVQLVGCTVQQCGADGANFFGPFDVRVDACSFDANVQEGIDFGPLVALPGLSSSLSITHSRFANNGAEGVDASLDRPLGITAGNGNFNVTVRGCTFTGNSLDGLLVDQEHEAAPGWSMRTIVRDCTASNNGLAGVHVDFDAQGQLMLHGIRSTGNGTDGILLTSEISSGVAIASACHLAGNLGAGIRTSAGNKIVLASHCTFAGNQQGGMISASAARESSAVNCIFDAQSTPTSLVRQLNNATGNSASAAVFANAPLAYTRATAHSNGVLTLPSAPTFAQGLRVELADDGTAFTAVQNVGSTVILDSTPTILRLPVAVAAFPSSSVVDNLALAGGSVAIGAGMKELGTGNVDAGPLGSPLQTIPGTAEPIADTLVYLDQIAPAPNVALGASQAVTLRFASTANAGASVDGGSVTNTSVRVINSSGNTVAAGLTTSASTITLAPPGGGWPSGALRLEVHRSVTVGGVAVSHPVLYPLR